MSCALTPAEVARSGIQTAFFTRLGPPESVPGGKSTIGAWNSSRGRYSGARTARRCCRANVIWEMSDYIDGHVDLMDIGEAEPNFAADWYIPWEK